MGGTSFLAMSRRSGVLVCQTSLCTPDAEIQASTCLLGRCAWFCWYGVDIAGRRYGRPLNLFWTRRVWCCRRRSWTVVLPHRILAVPLSGHHAERSRRPATRSRYPVPGGCLQRPTTPAGYEGVVRPAHASMLWSLPGPPASGSPIVTSHQTPPPDYGTACANHHRQPECSNCLRPGLLFDLVQSSPSVEPS